jgi:hypothetical protein
VSSSATAADGGSAACPWYAAARAAASQSGPSPQVDGEASSALENHGEGVEGEVGLMLSVSGIASEKQNLDHLATKPENEIKKESQGGKKAAAARLGPSTASPSQPMLGTGIQFLSFLLLACAPLLSFQSNLSPDSMRTPRRASPSCPQSCWYPVRRA